MDEKDLLIEVLYPPALPGWQVPCLDAHVRVTHLPTGLSAVSSCERSQLQNKAAAVAKLGKLLEARGAG